MGQMGQGELVGAAPLLLADQARGLVAALRDSLMVDSHGSGV